MSTSAAPPRDAGLDRRSLAWVQAVFFLSGFAAILYQVIWQRTLFSIYGINMESVTVVVTAFMLGLGFGSLAGGALSRDPRRPVLLYFALVEFGIALYGIASLQIFHYVGAFTLTLDPVVTALITFLLVLVPTLLMGATLPLLVAWAVRLYGNVGRSVGALYFINTLGSAIASFASFALLFPLLGLFKTVLVSAALNTITGLLVLGRWLVTRREAAP